MIGLPSILRLCILSGIIAVAYEVYDLRQLQEEIVKVEVLLEDRTTLTSALQLDYNVRFGMRLKASRQDHLPCFERYVSLRKYLTDNIRCIQLADIDTLISLFPQGGYIEEVHTVARADAILQQYYDVRKALKLGHRSAIKQTTIELINLLDIIWMNFSDTCCFDIMRRPLHHQYLPTLDSTKIYIGYTFTNNTTREYLIIDNKTIVDYRNQTRKIVRYISKDVRCIDVTHVYQDITSGEIKWSDYAMYY